ncbi:MAG: Smr/MutS family protein [Nitrosomonadales bacterium]|nr:Smr/MutS family protein [Nitrosomonadales bacterium]
MKTRITKQPDQIAPDDVALFHETVGAVKPLPEQNRITPPPAPRKPSRHFSHTPAAVIPDALSDFAAETAPDEYLSNGLSRMALRKLRRGTWPIQDRLDLHGNTSDTARKLLQEFLHSAAQQGLRCVLVIHGKGLNSRGGAVLRQLTRGWLMQHPRVLGYCEAPISQGGSGALLALLKQD